MSSTAILARIVGIIFPAYILLTHKRVNDNINNDRLPVPIPIRTVAVKYIQFFNQVWHMQLPH